MVQNNDFLKNMESFKKAKSKAKADAVDSPPEDNAISAGSKPKLQYRPGIVGSDMLLITETEADAAAANTHGYSAVAFDHYAIEDEEPQQELIEIAKQFEIGLHRGRRICSKTD